MGHALNKSLQLEGRDLIVQIGDPSYLAQIVAEGMQLGLNNAMIRPWMSPQQFHPMQMNLGPHPSPWSSHAWPQQPTYSMSNPNLPIYPSHAKPPTLAPTFQTTLAQPNSQPSSSTPLAPLPRTVPPSPLQSSSQAQMAPPTLQNPSQTLMEEEEEEEEIPTERIVKHKENEPPKPLPACSGVSPNNVYSLLDTTGEHEEQPQPHQ
ncbi:PREDICTED: extensin-like [Nicotiana attenuata]|uniref:extensin-like n=1 Tax=Nicotiana attenuata TaxID=49451 RepID=UPI0009052A76|nr:PREDICTED: extensin-like [Nicotiana attenuata]